MQGKSNFRIDLIDPTTLVKTGTRPIASAKRVSRQRGLDRIGKWSFDMSTVDLSLSEIEGKDFDFYWQWDRQTFYLGRGSYLNHSIRASGDGPTVAVQASGSLRDLMRQTVLARTFDGDTDDVNDVLTEIVPLRSGWSLGSVDTIATAAPMSFWYESIFEGVALLAKTFGYHFREGTTVQTLDFGAFGSSSGVLAVGGKREIPPGVYNNSTLCQITEMEITYEGDKVVNRLIPFGGAVGVATIDLSQTQTTQAGYAVQNAALPDSTLYYYIEDTDSQDTYGLTERRFVRKDLRPITNSQTAREFAADVLYEAALASLLNLKDRQTIYGLSVVGLQPGQIQVGDKINVIYRGWVQTPNGAQAWVDVDSDSQAGQGKAFYVLEISEDFGDGVSTRLTINENAVHKETVQDLLASTIQEFERSTVHIQPTITVYTVGPYVKRVDTSVDAEFSFNIGDETLNLIYAKMKIVGEPLKSSVSTVSSGGASTSGGGGSSTPTSAGTSTTHTHSTDYANTTTTTGKSPVYIHDTNGILFYYKAAGGSPITGTASSFESADHTHTVTLGDHTHSTPNHTHPLSYGIHEDATRPNSLTIKVNGSTVASGITLSAPDYDYALDITSDVLAAATLQADHSITVEAGSGQGEIVFQIQILSVIQPITVT